MLIECAYLRRELNTMDGTCGEQTCQIATLPSDSSAHHVWWQMCRDEATPTNANIKGIGSHVTVVRFTTCVLCKPSAFSGRRRHTFASTCSLLLTVCPSSLERSSNKQTSMDFDRNLMYCQTGEGHSVV